MKTPLITLILLLASALASFGADQKEFDRILNAKMADLTRESRATLEQRHPGEDWDAWKFPKYVYTSDAVETGYRIAVKEPELLRPIPCYCFCDEMGHKNLLHCFLKKGKERKYDDHAVTCNICYGQAMLAFLWKHKAGANEAEILGGMNRKFERLLKERNQGHKH